MRGLHGAVAAAACGIGWCFALPTGASSRSASRRFFHLCWDQGLPLPIPQYKIYDDSGRLVAVVDFAWPELGLFVEFDGKVKYKAPDRDGRDGCRCRAAGEEARRAGVPYHRLALPPRRVGRPLPAGADRSSVRSRFRRRRS